MAENEIQLPSSTRSKAM